MATILKKQQRAVAPSPPVATQTPIDTPRPGSGSVQILKSRESEATSSIDQSLPVPQGGVAARLSGAVIGKKKAGSEGLVEFNLADIVEQGQQQIIRCRAEVEAMLARAKVEGEQIKQQAKSAGHAEGKQVAAAEIEKRIAAEAEAKAKAQVEALRQTVVQMRTQYDQWMTQYAEVMTATAIAAAERLLRKKIELPNASLLAVAPDPEELADPQSTPSQADEHVLVRWARDALHSTRSAGRLTLAVHPDTLAELGRQFDELLSNPDLPEQSVVIPDETLSVGDVVVRQDGGEIRAGLDAQLQRLREELL